MVKTNKIIGQISDEILEKYKICMFRNTQIIQPSGLYKHISKHIDEFENIETYNYVVSNLSWIISCPDFVYYELPRNSLLYFKTLTESVCVVVKLNLIKNKYAYVASVYPVSKRKIERMKEKSYIINN
ncbi:MAG: hypothetical protein IJN13_05440 [Bacilli bacterium]|nr:hypothetical protein [Bacilli bacterium]